jgi:hypothetical protein
MARSDALAARIQAGPLEVADDTSGNVTSGLVERTAVDQLSYALASSRSGQLTNP